MLSIAYRTLMSVIVLLIMPLLVWISGWYWQPMPNIWWLNVLFWLTETATRPWGIITHITICIWFLWCLRVNLRTTVILFIIFSCTILIGQGIKFWIKEYIHELRPFVIWIEKMHHISIDEFYPLEYEISKRMLRKYLSEQQDIPTFLRQHWQKEIGFTCPSGHTIFTTSWALLAVALLWPQRRIFTIVILLIWTTGVMSSRLLLGMHWPSDLVVAILISWLLVILTSWFVQFICELSISSVYKDGRDL